MISDRELMSHPDRTQALCECLSSPRHELQYGSSVFSATCRMIQKAVPWIVPHRSAKQR